MIKKMQCLDSAEFPTFVTYEKDTFEDELLDINGTNGSELVVCGYHPQAPIPVSLESQESEWQRCKVLYELILVIAIGLVLLSHLRFIINFLKVKIKRAHYKQTHLRSTDKGKSNSDSKMDSDVTITSTPFPTTTTATIPMTSTMRKSKAVTFQLPSGMTQEDYIDFERYEHFIYSHARKF